MHIKAKSINSDVNAKLIGNAVIMHLNVGSLGNIRRIHVILTPHMPIIVRSAGGREMPNPRIYPDMTSYESEKKYAEKIITSLS